MDDTKDLDIKVINKANEVFFSEIALLCNFQQELCKKGSQINKSFVESVTLISNCTGRIILTGVGKSGLSARNISLNLSAIGLSSYYFQPTENIHSGVNSIHPNDIVICVSQSGETPDLMTIMPLLKALTSALVVVTANPDSSLARLADVCIDLLQCDINAQSSIYYSNITLVTTIANAIAICLNEQSDGVTNHRTQLLRDILKQPVSSVMHKKNIPIVLPEHTCAQAVKKLNESGLGTLFVAYPSSAESYQLIGSLSDDNIRDILAKGQWDAQTPVDECMQLSPRTIQLSTTVEEALFLLHNSKQNVLPVINKLGLLVGYITIHDFIKYTTQTI